MLIYFQVSTGDTDTNEVSIDWTSMLDRSKQTKCIKPNLEVLSQTKWISKPGERFFKLLIKELKSPSMCTMCLVVVFWRQNSKVLAFGWHQGLMGSWKLKKKTFKNFIFCVLPSCTAIFLIRRPWMERKVYTCQTNSVHICLTLSTSWIRVWTHVYNFV